MHLIDEASVQQFKAIRLIHCVMAYIHIYLEPSASMPFKAKLEYVRNMILHKDVREALPIYLNEMSIELGKYQKILLYLMDQKSLLGIYLITAYSRFRNRKVWG